MFLSHLLGETIVEESILDECPFPDHVLLKSAKRDADMIDLLPAVARAPEHHVESRFQRVQQNICQVTGQCGLMNRAWDYLPVVMVLLCGSSEVRIPVLAL